MSNISKILILSFEKTQEHIIHEILLDVQRRTKDFQIISSVMSNDILYRGELVIESASQNVKKNGKNIYLTSYEFNVLYLLAKRPGWIYSRESIYDLVWKEPFNYSKSAVGHVIGNLRKKIEDDRNHLRYIQTVWDRGYKFNSQFNTEVSAKGI